MVETSPVLGSTILKAPVRSTMRISPVGVTAISMASTNPVAIVSTRKCSSDGIRVSARASEGMQQRRAARRVIGEG